MRTKRIIRMHIAGWIIIGASIWLVASLLIGYPLAPNGDAFSPEWNAALSHSLDGTQSGQDSLADAQRNIDKLTGHSQ
jgi:hypothetical protein